MKVTSFSVTGSGLFSLTPCLFEVLDSTVSSAFTTYFLRLFPVFPDFPPSINILFLRMAIRLDMVV